MAIWHKIGHWWYRMLIDYKTRKIVEANRKREEVHGIKNIWRTDMVLQDYKVDGEYICISKKELEECRDHYHKLAQHHKENRDSFRQPFYLGKRDVCIDILKMFEQL